ncbi:RNB domain-containing protein, partial [Haematococcus lacustris]
VLAASPPPDPHATTRLNLTHLRCITIDDQSTTEVDDGLSVQLIDTDGPLGLEGLLPGLSAVRFWVHVADPDRWLRPGWPGVEQLLESARSRGGRSLYFPWGNAPMFPRCLSEGPFSLRQHKEVEVLSFGAVLRSDGSLADLCVSPARVRVTHKLTYQQADQLLATAQGASPPAAATFHQTTTDTIAAANGSSSSGGAGGGNDGSEQQCA